MDGTVAQGRETVNAKRGRGANAQGLIGAGRAARIVAGKLREYGCDQLCPAGGHLTRSVALLRRRPNHEVAAVSCAAVLACLVVEAASLAMASETTPAQESKLPDFRLPPGFAVERVAGPPLVRYPLFAAFDDQGRLFVAEGTGTNLPGAFLREKKLGRITRLEDLDGDGIFDSSTVFADSLVFPQGVLWRQGALTWRRIPASGVSRTAKARDEQPAASSWSADLDSMATAVTFTARSQDLTAASTGPMAGTDTRFAPAKAKFSRGSPPGSGARRSTVAKLSDFAAAVSTIRWSSTSLRTGKRSARWIRGRVTVCFTTSRAACTRWITLA